MYNMQSRKENLKHFLSDCSEYNEIRTLISKLQQPYNESRNEIIGKLLFKLDNKAEVDPTGEIIYRMWKRREKLEKDMTS